MLLNHLAAVLLFSGPLFYIGAWMVVDPAAFMWLPNLVVRAYRNGMRGMSGATSEGIVKIWHAGDSRRLRRAVRFTGVGLVLFAIAV